jgi:acyl-coenzyme A thioesterase PaaI-like protein
MKLIQSILLKAQSSSFYLWLLNRLLWRLIPFNHSHKVSIHKISDEQVIIKLPYKRSNQNHLKGMHACALATLCEYACGIGLMTKLDPKNYRIILKEIKLDYLAQAKSDVFAAFTIDDITLQNEVIKPLSETGVIVKTYTIEAFDKSNKAICTGQITWQLKKWDMVRK